MRRAPTSIKSIAHSLDLTMRKSKRSRKNRSGNTDNDFLSDNKPATRIHTETLIHLESVLDNETQETLGKLLQKLQNDSKKFGKQEDEIPPDAGNMNKEDFPVTLELCDDYVKLLRIILHPTLKNYEEKHQNLSLNFSDDLVSGCF